MTYYSKMVFIETLIFTKLILDLMSEDKYRELQKALILNPDIGDLIPSTGGLRKIRWSLEGRGKRGGVRVIYYWKVKENQIIFLLAYPKNVQDNLTSEQLKSLKRVMAEELNNG